MDKKAKQLIENCEDEHDRELMRKSLEKFDKSYGICVTLMWIATAFAAVGIFGLNILKNDYFILAFIPVFPLMFIVMVYNLKNVGIV